MFPEHFVIKSYRSRFIWSAVCNDGGFFQKVQEVLNFSALISCLCTLHMRMFIISQRILHS